MYTPARESLPALVAPIPTAQKRAAAFGQRIDWQVVADGAKDREPVVLPALDIAKMQDTYHPANGNKPRVLTGTFRVPLGMPRVIYERVRNQAVAVFLKMMGKKGYDLAGRVTVFPGVYPARDLLSGAALLGEREFMVQAAFVYRAPKVIRLELPPSWREPHVITDARRCRAVGPAESQPRSKR